MTNSGEEKEIIIQKGQQIRIEKSRQINKK